MANKKKKLLAWCDFLVPTGFGTVSKNLFKGLSKEYDVFSSRYKLSRR